MVSARFCGVLRRRLRRRRHACLVVVAATVGHSAATMMRQKLATAVRQRQLLNHRFSQGLWVPVFAGTTAVKHAKSPRGTRCPRFCSAFRALRIQTAQRRPDAGGTRSFVRKKRSNVRAFTHHRIGRHPAFPARWILASIVSGPHSQAIATRPCVGRNASDLTLKENRRQADKLQHA